MFNLRLSLNIVGKFHLSPDTVTKERQISCISAKNEMLAFYEGIYTHSNSRQNVLIREFCSSEDKVESKMNKEFEVINLLHMFKIETGLIGYYYENQGQKSVLVTRRYLKCLKDITDEDEEIKIGFLFQLATMLNQLKKLQVFLGYFNPLLIYINEDSELVLGTVFFAYFTSLKKHKIQYQQYLHLIEGDFLAPELILMKSLETVSKEQIEALCLNLADFYSLGLIACSFFGLYQQIEIEDKLNTLNNILDIVNSGDIILPENPLITQLSRKIKSRKYFECILVSLHYSINRRLGFYKRIYKNFQPRQIKKKRFEDNAIGKSDFKYILERFEKLLRSFYEANFDDTLDLKIVKEIINFKKKINNDLLLLASDSFLNTVCMTTKFKVADGIVHFILLFVNDISYKTDQLNKLITIMKTQNFAPSFISRLKSIFNLDPVLQDFYLNGICRQTWGEDWKYFFPERKSNFAKTPYVNLCELPEYFNECFRILSHQKLLQILSKYSKYQIDLLSFIKDVALSHIYIIMMQPSLIGMTTYNKNIFVHSFGANLNYFEARFRVVIFLIIIRELANFLRSFDCRTFKESMLRKASNGSWNFDDFEDKKETENIRNQDPGEAGAEIELELLGTNLTSINEKAALYFLRLEFDDPAFTQNLIELNNKPGQCVERDRSVVSFKGKRCGVSLHPK